MSRTDIVDRIDRHLGEIAALRESLLVDRAHEQRVEQIKDWQAARLAHTYADLLGSERYSKAARFFLSDLYGTQDFSQRDADLARIVPTVERLLPASALEAVGMAIELHALSERLDHALADRFDCPSRQYSTVLVDDSPTTRAYASAYADDARRAERARQIELVGITGYTMDRMVHVPLIHAAVRMMRGPARAAGLSALQEFLERGHDAFAAMHGAQEFLDCIQSRERMLMERLFARAQHPFGFGDGVS